MTSNSVQSILNDSNYKKCNFKNELSKIFFQDKKGLSIYDFMPEGADKSTSSELTCEGEEFVDYDKNGKISKYVLAKNNSEAVSYSRVEQYSYFDNGMTAEELHFVDIDGDGVFDNKTYIKYDENTASSVKYIDENMDNIMDYESYEIYDESKKNYRAFVKSDRNDDHKIDHIVNQEYDSETNTFIYQKDTDMDGKYNYQGMTRYRAYDTELLESKEEYLINVDGKIDNSFQGETGDCWLLSALNSLNDTKTGRKMVKDAITIKDDGSYEVNLSGVGRKYTFTDDDLKQARENEKYSSGDDDVLLFELAIEKDRKAFRPGNIINAMIAKVTNKDVLYEGVMGDALRYFDESYSAYSDRNHQTVSLEHLKEIVDDKSKDYAITLNALAKKTDKEELLVKDVSGNDVTLARKPENHGWSVTSYDNGIITIVNPADSGKEIQINEKELEPYLDDTSCLFNYVELKSGEEE